MSVNARRRLDLSNDPFAPHDGPQHLIHPDPVPTERLAQDGFARRAELLQCAVAAAVFDDGAGFETLDRQGLEREVDYAACRCLKDSRPPEGRADREAPFGQAELVVERAHLDDADRIGSARGDDAEADVLALGLLATRPGDELPESLDGRRR